MEQFCVKRKILKKVDLEIFKQPLISVCLAKNVNGIRINWETQPRAHFFTFVFLPVNHIPSLFIAK